MYINPYTVSMFEHKGLEFIAERPQIFDNDLKMLWPNKEDFEALRDELYPHLKPDNPDDEDNWQYRDGIYHLRDDYFRLRYRGAQWAYERFTGEELPEDKKDKLDAFLLRGYWAPAIDTSLDLYDETQDDIYRQTAIFACGLHIYDAIQHSWGFLDETLANDSGVREKHFLIFLDRVADVAKLPMDEIEQGYFLPLQQQFNLAFAEMAAQSPITATRDLLLFDKKARDANEDMQDVLYNARSSVNFDNASREVKLRVIERFKHAAYAHILSPDNWSSTVFHLQALHLFGLINMADFCSSDGKEMQWWKLSAEELLAGDTSNLKPVYQLPEPDSSSTIQDSLF